MSSIYSGTTGSRGSNDKGILYDNSIYKFWDENVKGILFGVMYAMVKENAITKPLVVISFIIEFFQLVILCFRDTYRWGGVDFSFDFNYKTISFTAYEIVTWTIISILSLALLNFAYVGYAFYKGEIRQSFFLKAMRWFVASFVSIFFIPVLYVLFSGLACNYSPVGRLLQYPQQPCWGSHTPLAVVSIITLVLFCLSCFFSVLTFYTHDSTVVKSASRLQNRFESVVLLTKLVLTIVAVFAVHHPRAFLAVSVCLTFFLFLASVFMLPYYDHKINLIRSGLLAGVFYVNVGMVVAYLVDTKSMAPLVVFTVGILLAAAAGAFAAHKRFTYLCDPNLVNGVISSEEMESFPVQPGKKKRSVKFEQPKSNTLFKNKLYTRLRFPWDVEIAARFIVNGNPNSALIEKAKLVYQTGMSKFPKSPTVLQGYANFMFTIVGDWQLGYVILEKLRKTSVFLDIQFVIYSCDKDRERRSEGGHDRIGDFVDFIEYKKQQQLAHRHHMTCMSCIRKFWCYLLEPKIDVMKLSVLSSKIALAEKKASEQYVKLLSNHPKNVSILRDYAKFLDEVVLDERGAFEIRKKADKYEHEEMESNTASHRSNNVNIAGHTSEGSNSDHESEMRSELSGESWDDRTVSSKSSGVRGKIMESRLDKYNGLKKLGYVMLATTAFVITVAIIEVIVLNSMISTYDFTIESQNSAGGAAHSAMRATRSVADAYLVARRYWQQNATFPILRTFPDLVADVKTTLIVLGNNLKSLYWGDSDSGSFATPRFLSLKEIYGYPIYTNISDHVMSYEEFDHVLPGAKSIERFFTEQRYNQSNYVTDPNVTGYGNTREFEKTGLWSLSSLFITSTTDILTLQFSDYAETARLMPKFPSVAFCFENSQALAQGMIDLIIYYSTDITKTLNNIVDVVMIIFVVAAAMLILAAIFMFRPIVNKIFSSKVRTFTMFTIIPHSVVRVMTKKKIANMTKYHSSDEEDAEDDKKKRPEGFSKWKPKSILVESEKMEGPKLQTEIEVEHNVLLPNSTDIVDNTQTITSISDDGIISSLPSISAELHNGAGEGGKIEEERDSLVVIEIEKEKEDKTNEEIQARPSSRIGELFARKIASITNVFRRGKNTYRRVDEEDKEKETEKEKQDGDSDKKKSHKNTRLDVSSLNAVTRNMHFSYLLGIACIIAGLLAAFLVSRTFLSSLLRISTDLQDSDLRTQYIQTVSMDFAILALYSYGGTTASLFKEYAQKDLTLMWETHKSVEPRSYQMDLLYFSDCLTINQSRCPTSTNKYYGYVNQGFDFALYQYYTIGKSMLAEYNLKKTAINASSTDYVTFRAITEIIIDGAERLTFSSYMSAKDRIDVTKRYIAIITAVQCVGFLLIYFIFFRPFVKKLRSENEHTFALIRMIPRKLLRDVPEIQEFIQDTLDGTSEDD